MTHEIKRNEDDWDSLGPAEAIPAEPLPGVEVGVEEAPESDFDLLLDYDSLTREYSEDGLQDEGGEKTKGALRAGSVRAHHVVVQMGHVARTKGATGTAGEQVFARAAAAHLAGRLRDWYGHRVTVIGADDTIPRSDFFVAIHCDGSTSSSARGASVGYRNNDGQHFGAAWKAAYTRLGWPSFRGDNYTPALRDFYGTRRANAASTRWAIICEAGFLTNPSDRALLDNTAGHERFAQAVCNAIGSLVGHPRQPQPPTPKPQPQPQPKPPAPKPYTRRYAMLLFAPSQPDYDAWEWAHKHIAPCPHPIVQDRNTVGKAKEAGETVVTLGGSSAMAVGDRIAGANRRETFNKIADFAANGWKK